MNQLVILIVLLPLLAGILLLAIRHTPLLLRRGLTVTALLAQVVLAVLLIGRVGAGDILVYALGNWPAPFGIVLVADRLAAWLLLITAVLALFVALDAARGEDGRGRHFHVLLQWQLFGLNGAFLTGDLFNLFVFFEILLLASYGLMLHGGGRLRTRAGLHYVVINLAGSILFLFAVGTLYGVLGTLNMADLAQRVAATPAENVAVVRAAGLLLFGVFALKAALLPLYLWLPAAYANTSAPVAALFAIMTKVGAYAILRVYTLIFGAQAGPLANLIEPWLLPLALATLAVGMLGVLASTGLRQQAAYLVVASVGTLLAAFGLNTVDGIAAGLYYLPHTTFAAAALFLLAAAIGHRRGELADRFEPGPRIAHARVFGGMFFVAAVLSAGLPPLSGFVGKFLILRAAIEHPAAAWMLGVVLFAGLMAVIALARSGSLLFYLPVHELDRAEPRPALAATLLPITGLLLLGLGLTVWADPVLRASQAIAWQLLQPYEYVHAVLGAR